MPVFAQFAVRGVWLSLYLGIFNLLPVPQENGTDGYQSGQLVYVVEVLFTGAGQVGYTQGRNYAYAVF